MDDVVAANFAKAIGFGSDDNRIQIALAEYLTAICFSEKLALDAASYNFTFLIPSILIRLENIFIHVSSLDGRL